MSDGRVPPHNLDAEESLLGAMLLSADARRAGLDDVTAADYYRPPHGALHDAIEQLDAAGEPCDVVTVAARLESTGHLDAVGGRQRLMELQANTPASSNAAHYAGLVRDCAIARRAIAAAGALEVAGYDGDLDAIAAALDAAPLDVLRSLGSQFPVDDLDALAALADLDDVTPAKPWLVPGTFRMLETGVITGGEGWGKATLMRQWGVCVSSGLHPFLHIEQPMEGAHRVLYVDLQEDRIDAAHETRRLRRAAGDHYVPGGFRVVTRPQGMNLLAPRDRRWLESVIADNAPDLVLMGPIVRMFRADGRQSRNSEDVVDEVTDRLDELRVRYQFALVLEGHAGNDRSDNMEDAWRVRGSSVWRSWPMFGVGLKPAGSNPRQVELRHWRPGRHAGRLWPRMLRAGNNPERGWPWMLPGEDYERFARGLQLDWLIDGGEDTLALGYEPEEPF